tara:strand:- start:1363 stop:1638 length:276 start_codon:yes stop_codon:yes gene_type:complete
MGGILFYTVASGFYPDVEIKAFNTRSAAVDYFNLVREHNDATILYSHHEYGEFPRAIKHYINDAGLMRFMDDPAAVPGGLELITEIQRSTG